MMRKILIFLLSLLVITACEDTTPEPQEPTVISYEGEDFTANYQIQGSKWNTCDLTYFISNFSSDFPMQNQIDGIQFAFDLWSDAVGLSFSRQMTSSNADIIIDFANISHNCPSSPFSSGVIAHAFFPPPTNGAIAGDIHFNDEGFDFADDLNNNTDIDFISVAIHEIGHSLGLGHSEYNNAVMYESYTVGNHIRNLHFDDIAGIKAIYEAQCGSGNGGNGNDTKIIDVSGNLTFGSVSVRQQASQNFKIKNIGTEILNITSINVPNGYSLNWNSGSVSVGSEINISVTFSPQTASSYNGNIIVNSDAQSGTNSISVTGSGSNTNTFQFTDSRDGKIYNYIEIGGLYWMTENLDYNSSNSVCYDNSNYYCNQYGRLYSYQEVMQGGTPSNNVPSGVQGICPNGWHLPSQLEWQILVDEYDDGNIGNLSSEIYNALIEGGASGFEAKLGGYSIGNNIFQGRTLRTRFWTASEFNVGIPYGFFMTSIGSSVEINYTSSNSQYYCRCVKD